MKKLIILTLVLASCKKQDKEMCQCYEQEYTLSVVGTQPTYVYTRDLLPYTDFCFYNNRTTENGSKRYVTVCK